MVKKDFPLIHYYDQDFVDIYERSWIWMDEFLQKGDAKNNFGTHYFSFPENEEINFFETQMACFFLVYNNRNFPVEKILNSFYSKQEENGAIRWKYSKADGKAILPQENPQGLCPPLIAWIEYDHYHKVGNKRRVKDIMPVLERYFAWLENNFRAENGLYSVPLAATMMENSPRDGMVYPVDFNAQMAINALYMSALGEILNDKELSFKYRKHYFSLKTRMNNKMWNHDENYYYDLDKDENQIKVKTIASFWPLLAEMPNEDRAELIIEELKNPETFASENPFPTLAMNDPKFSQDGEGFCGSVYSPFVFMIIKGIEKYNYFEFARESAIKHLYAVLDTFHPEKGQKGTIWEAYKPNTDGPATKNGDSEWNRKIYLGYTGLSTITLMIENVIGLFVSLPRKTVDWIVPVLELMGIENLNLKRNKITILSNKTARGWEIRLESEKLYYFTIDILGEKKKTLPIPSGKCSMLIDKL
ncbi:MAG: trehalase family glycosidase [Spirochaetaceae bacterium]|nr:trehalase family glycosidase [Spirochaetaceae bacterium]